MLRVDGERCIGKILQGVAGIVPSPVEATIVDRGILLIGGTAVVIPDVWRPEIRKRPLPGPVFNDSFFFTPYLLRTWGLWAFMIQHSRRLLAKPDILRHYHRENIYI
jgi:hypothetical protein